MSVTAGAIVAGVDIGGTRTKLALVGPDGLVVTTEVLQREGERADDVVGTVLARLRDERVAGLGVALPGLVERTFGSRDLPGKLPGFSGRDLYAEFTHRLQVPVVCLNDGQAAAIGEWRAGAGQGYDDLVVVTLGTGVGSGVILRGRPLVGGHLGVGNGVGHLSIDPDGDSCLCGNVGCPETRISATAVVAAARTHLDRGVASSLATAGEPLTFERIAAAAAGGDALAARLMDRFVHDLGATLGNAVQAYGPSAIILAGGMVVAATAYLADVRRYVETHAWRYPRDRGLPIIAAALGDHSGAVGAAFEVAGEVGGAPDPSPAD